MKATLLFLFVITLGYSQNPNATKVYDLASVLENNWITLKVTGNENSTHYTFYSNTYYPQFSFYWEETSMMTS